MIELIIGVKLPTINSPALPQSLFLHVGVRTMSRKTFLINLYVIISFWKVF